MNYSLFYLGKSPRNGRVKWKNSHNLSVTLTVLYGDGRFFTLKSEIDITLTTVVVGIIVTLATALALLVVLINIKAIPAATALAALSGVISKTTKEYHDRMKNQK